VDEDRLGGGGGGRADIGGGASTRRDELGGGGGEWRFLFRGLLTGGGGSDSQSRDEDAGAVEPLGGASGFVATPASFLERLLFRWWWSLDDLLLDALDGDQPFRLPSPSLKPSRLPIAMWATLERRLWVSFFGGLMLSRAPWAVDGRAAEPPFERTEVERVRVTVDEDDKEACCEERRGSNCGLEEAWLLPMAAFAAYMVNTTSLRWLELKKPRGAHSCTGCAAGPDTASAARRGLNGHPVVFDIGYSGPVMVDLQAG